MVGRHISTEATLGFRAAMALWYSVPFPSSALACDLFCTMLVATWSPDSAAQDVTRRSSPQAPQLHEQAA